MAIRADVERALLGAMILDPRIVDESEAEPGWFHGAASRKIFEAIRAIHDGGFKPDLISIGDKDPTIPKLDLATVTDAIPSAANWRYYESALRDEWASQELRKVAAKLADSAHTVEARIDEAEADFMALTMKGRGYQVQGAGDVLPRVRTLIESRYKNRGRTLGPQTGIQSLDSRILCLEPRLFYVIGGRPSGGKSALGQTIALNLAHGQHVPVGFITIESSADELYCRFCANLAEVEGRRIRSGFLTQEHRAALERAEGELVAAPIYTWDKPNATFREVRAAARYMVRVRKAQVIIVDYLQLVKWPGAKDRTEAAGEVSRALKELARELNVAVVALAQLRREADERRPTMGDFQWASQIEQDADVGILLWHKLDGAGEIAESYAIIAKARDGRTGAVKLDFQRDYVRFVEPKEGEGGE